MKRVSGAVVVMVLVTLSAHAHDAWLAAKWNKDKTRITISALVAEHFPHGEPIKGVDRFVGPRAYLPAGVSIALAGDPSDSTLLGSLPPEPTMIVATGVKQREITFKGDLAEQYLREEIGLTKREASHYLTPHVEEFRETYSRIMKIVVATDSHTPQDSVLGLPLEIVVKSWKDTGQDRATIQFQLLYEGVAVSNAPVRVITNRNTTVVRTDKQGLGQVSVDPQHPVLLAHIRLSQLAAGRLNSLWTNVAIYRLTR